MIFTLELRYRNCPACQKKVQFHPIRCGQCRTPFSQESNQMITLIQQETRKRMQYLWDGGEADPNQVYFSKFYPAFGAYHHILGIPLYTLNEALIVQNLMYRGNPHTNEGGPSEWIASFRYADQSQEMPRRMCLLSWQRLLWHEDQQVYLVDPDEGSRTVDWTPFE